ncbi:unnamed protein product, partial [Laminaria digitata]
YECVLHSKFRFRSATFYKTSRLELAFEKHKDRVLVTGLRRLPLTAAVAAVAAAEDVSPPSEPQLIRPPQSAQPPPPPPTPKASDHTTDPPIIVGPCSGDGARHTDSNSGGGGGSGSGGGGVSSVGGKKGPRLIAVVNCHLTGGPAPERRMRQVFDGLDAARKEATRFLAAEIAATAAAAVAGEGGKGKGFKKGKKGGGGGAGGSGAKPVGTSVPVVVCGDFNSNGRTAVWELLTQGVVEAPYRERGYPETAITSKDKRQAFGAFGDVYEEAYSDGDRPHGGQGQGGEGGDGMGPPPTFLVPLLHPHFLAEDGEGLSPRLQVALSQVFHSFVAKHPIIGGINSSSNSDGGTAIGDTGDVADTGAAVAPAGAPFLPRQGVEEWLVGINRKLGRGSEFRAAEAFMGPAPGGGLTLE